MLKLFSRSTSGSKELKIPNCWEEVIVQQYQRMVKEWDRKDRIKLFSILSGQQYDAISRSKDFKLEGTLYASTDFVFCQPVDFSKLPVPEFLVLKDKTIQIPKKLGSLSIGQKIHIRQALENAKDLKELISLATAVYLQPLVDGEDFDIDKALRLEGIILRMPIMKIYPIGFFFLRQLNPTGRRLLNAWLLLKQQIAGRGQQSPGWLR